MLTAEGNKHYPWKNWKLYLFQARKQNFYISRSFIPLLQKIVCYYPLGGIFVAFVLILKLLNLPLLFSLPEYFMGKST